MKVSKEAQRLGRQLFRSAMVNGRLDEDRVRSLSKAVLAKKPRGYVQILEALTNQVRLELNRRHAVIESAVALDAAVQQKVAADLTKDYGEGLTFEYRVNPELLGGMRVRVGNDVWDGSVKARLEQLVDAL
ncbi:MAG: F0F1 ATP synthase subunit delta [Verrucomicrobiota bacterium]